MIRIAFACLVILLTPLCAAAFSETSVAPLWREALDLMETGNNQDAVALLDDLRRREGFPKAGEAHFLLGVALYRQQRWQEAAGTLEAATTRVPLLGDYALSYAASAYRTLGLNAQALALLSRLLHEYPDSLLAERARQERAQLYLDTHQLAEAEETYRDYLSRTSGDTRRREAMLALAEIAVQANKPREAEPLLRELWLKWPASREAKRAGELLTSMPEVLPFTADEQFERALSLYRGGQYAQAIAAFAPFLGDTSHPIDGVSSQFAARARLWTGISHFQRRDYHQAIDLLSPLVQGRSFHTAEALYWIGRSYARLDDRQQAIATWVRLVGAFPNSPFTAESLYLMALEHRDNAQPKRAVQTLTRLLRGYASSRFADPALWTRAWIHYRRSAFTQALADLRRLYARGAAAPQFQTQALYWQGRILEDLNKRGKAAATYRRLLDAHSDEDYYAEQSRRRLRMLDRKAAQTLPIATKRQVDVPPPCSSSPAPCSSETAKARLLKELKLRGEASEEFRALAARYADDRGVLYEACNALVDLGQFEKSVWIAKRMLHPLYVHSRPAEPVQRYWEFLYPLGYWGLIEEQSARYTLDPYLVVALVREESAFGERVVSSSGAVGLMQLLPVTANSLVNGAGQSAQPVKLDVPPTNIALGTRYLAMMIQEFKGNWAKALAAYNAGPNQVRRWLARSGNQTDDEFIEEIPFTETRAYVKRVLGSYYRYLAQYSTLNPKPLNSSL